MKNRVFIIGSVVALVGVLAVASGVEFIRIPGYFLSGLALGYMFSEAFN